MLNFCFSFDDNADGDDDDDAGVVLMQMKIMKDMYMSCICLPFNDVDADVNDGVNFGNDGDDAGYGDDDDDGDDNKGCLFQPASRMCLPRGGG